MANTVRSVWEIQVILNALGAKLPVDKTFGPITQSVWEVLAKGHNLNPHFVKVSATDASVDKSTYDVVADEYAKRKAPKPQPVSGDNYISLNNAIVSMGRVDLGSQRDQLGFTNPVKFKKLADGWASVFESPGKRSLMMAVPPLWAQFLTTNWMNYRDIYNAAPLNSRIKMPHPAALEPGGIVQAFKDLWVPALAIASDSVKQVLRQAGVSFAQGAAEVKEKEIFSWAWALAGVGLLGGLAYYATRKSGARGLNGLGAVWPMQVIELRTGKRYTENVEADSYAEAYLEVAKSQRAIRSRQTQGDIAVAPPGYHWTSQGWKKTNGL